MSRVKYKDICGGEQRKFTIRVEMVQHAEEEGVRRTAAAYGTTAKTVRKWRDRYREKGVTGLEDRSRRPKKSRGRRSRRALEPGREGAARVSRPKLGTERGERGVSPSVFFLWLSNV